MIGAEGNNYLSVAPGANYALTSKHIEQARSGIEGAAIIVMQYEIPQNTILYVLDLSKKLGIPVIWNFAPAKEVNLEAFGKCDILIVNETEAGFLSNTPVIDKDSAIRATQKLLALGAREVVITLGSQGAVFTYENTVTYVPAFSVDAKDTTGAGDTFCGVLAVGLVEGKPFGDCIRFASAASAICVQNIGAQPSIPHRPEIETFLTKRR